MRDTKGEEKPRQVTLSADGGKWEMQSGQGAHCLCPPQGGPGRCANQKASA